MEQRFIVILNFDPLSGEILKIRLTDEELAESEKYEDMESYLLCKVTAHLNCNNIAHLNLVGCSCNFAINLNMLCIANLVCNSTAFYNS